MPKGGVKSTGRKKQRDEKTSAEKDEYMKKFWNFYFYDPEVPDEREPKTADKKENINDSTVLKVDKLDLDVRNNAVANHTDEYDITHSEVYDSTEELVVRRGQDFTFKIKFNRQYDVKKDDLRLIFAFNKKSPSSKGGEVKFNLSDPDEPRKWGAAIREAESSKDCLIVVVTTPPTCAVGKWTLKIDVVKKKGNNKADVLRYIHKDPIHILFNPWCKDDQVYMEDEKLRSEYVLNEDGSIYRGTRWRSSACPWVFGQFTGNVLKCVEFLLDGKTDMSITDRQSPAMVTRKLTSLINSCDNDGVLEGNWSGDYSGGTPPCDWTGSVRILEEYFKTKETVSFGQCWVFSGVLTTVCRALGIPARSVTNFASAHDTDKSMTIDSGKKQQEDGTYDTDDDLTDDSVWNFHVWNEAWMARPDLPAGYGGWQAIDATPQEESGGVYCCGPFPVDACKKGDVYLQHDGPFIFSEVNADRVTWVTDLGCDPRVVGVRTSAVGVNISTKSAYGDDREVVTNNYKYPEGSPEERAAVRKANTFSTRQDVYKTTSEDVKFEILCDHDNTFVGQDLKLRIKVTNTSSAKRTVSGSLNVSPMYYTGVTKEPIKKQKHRDIEVNGKESKIIEIELPESEYKDHMLEHCMLRSDCVYMVNETKQIFVESEDLRLRKPHLTIEAPTTGKVGQKFQIQASFDNPFSYPLTKCSVTIEGPGLQEPVKLEQLKDVPKGGKFTLPFEMTPVKAGSKAIVINFSSAEVYGVNGKLKMTITK